MHWFVSIIAGIAVGFAWLVIWGLVLRAFGIDFFPRRIAFFPRQTKDRDGRRERIKQMGQMRYVLIFGVLGSGLAFGLAITTADFLDSGSFRSMSIAIVKLVFLTVLFGLFHGFRTWSEFSDPVPFPPKYPPAK